MMQKRSLYSLLLTSFMLVFAFSLSYAQSVTFESKTVLRCQDNTIDVTVDNPTDISAFEIVFAISGDGDITGVSWSSGLGVLTHRYIDLSDPGCMRIAGMMIDPGDNCLAAGQTVVAQVSILTHDVCSGAAVVDGAECDVPECETCIVPHETQFVECASGLLVPAAVTAGTVTIENAAPTIADIDDISVHWIDCIAPITVDADDDDLHSLPGGCESLSYSISAPTAAGAGPSISGAGVITWCPTGADIGVHEITVTVNDACPYRASASTSFSACVWNIPPTLACDQDTVEIYWGYNASGTVTGDDPDGGPSPLEYSVCGFSGPGSVGINPLNGDWSWDTDEQVPYLGCHTLCIEVTDKANTDPTCSPFNSAQCEVTICVLSTADIVIEKTHGTIQGGHEYVSVYIDWSLLQMGGFDFLISYDASAIAAVGVTLGQLLEDCGWEYFEYRFGADGNCGNGCPSGLLRIVAIAEMNNGMNHPTCFGPTTTDPYELAVIDFTVTNDRTFECMYVPIRFFWADCGDNAISNVLGDLLYLDRRVYVYDGPLLWDEEDDVLYPEAARIFPGNYGAPDICLAAEEGKPMPRRIIDFHNGGVDIICADSIDARGDINLNGIAHEVADAVLFTNYFVYGIGVFTENVNGQIAASDVNADGITLSVADLVHLIRVIVGDALPYFKPGTPAKVNYVHADNGLMTVDGAQIGAAFVVAEGEVIPQLKADGMEMRYAFDGTNTRILIYSLDANSFTGEFLNINGNVLSIEMATADGNQVNAKLIPSNFSLAQNYPNPFNPTTSIAFSLPMASDYTLTIFNVSGQTIQTFEGANEAGNVVLDWDANDLASGIYFYRLDAGAFSQTKKMVLLK